MAKQITKKELIDMGFIIQESVSPVTLIAGKECVSQTCLVESLEEFKIIFDFELNQQFPLYVYFGEDATSNTYLQGFGTVGDDMYFLRVFYFKKLQ